MSKYSFNVVWDDSGYVATIPELPGLSACGDTPEEAIKEAQFVAPAFFEVMYERIG